MNRLESEAEEARLRAEILERVRRLGELRREPVPFEPGKTPVRYAGRFYGPEEMVCLVDSSLEFWLTSGHWHHRLERDLAKWFGVPAARLVNSGSSANLLAVTALTSHLLGPRRLRPGDEVITVAAGFPTTVAPLIQNRLVPVFVDVALPTYNASVASLEAARSDRTRAVMLAHTLGNPFDLDAVRAFCQAHDLWLVEDNCDAAGALYRGRKTGTFGQLATLSFYPAHQMTTGEGGAVLCNDESLIRPLESIRDWGRDCWCQSGKDNTCGKRFEWELGKLPLGYDHKYIYSHLGYNLKMTEMQAAVGCAQLARLDSFVSRRRENWSFFREALADLEDVFVLPEPTDGSDPSWFGFLMTVKPGCPLTRDQLVQRLEERKIQTRMLFAGNITRQPALSELLAEASARNEAAPFRTVDDLASTDRIMQHSLWIGVYPGLTEEMRGYVASEIRRAVQR